MSRVPLSLCQEEIAIFLTLSKLIFQGEYVTLRCVTSHLQLTFFRLKNSYILVISVDSKYLRVQFRKLTSKIVMLSQVCVYVCVCMCI